METEIRVPTLGESVTEAIVGKWFKKSGDTVNVDEPLVELETDKVTLEVPASASGTLGAIDADEGVTVEVGALLGAIAEGAGACALAAALTGRAGNGPIAVIISGGNIDLAVFTDLVTHPATCR